MDHEERDRAEAQSAGAFADELRAIHADEAALQARKLRLLARAFELAETQKARIPSMRSRERDMPLRSLAAELGLAVRMNDRTMQSHLWDAHRLVTDFPATVDALGSGDISRAHASAILDAGADIDDASARGAYEQAVLDHARGTTAARTRSFAQQQADIHNPRTLQERHDSAVQGRRIWVTDLADGMSQLNLLTSTALAHGILDRTTRQAKLIKRLDAAARRDSMSAPVEGDGAGGDHVARGEDASTGAAADDTWFDQRTIDQTRADLVIDLLLTGSPAIDPTLDASPGGLGAIRAMVQVTVPVTTLTGVTTGGAELDGRAPVDAETARRLAGDAPGWDRVMTDPVTGIVLTVDRYQPSAEQKRFLHARDQHCRFPGCRRPARSCDHDHTQDFALGGPTEICNLACFCKRHHTLKHNTDWTVRQLPGGTLEWTSPAGAHYLEDPPARVVFVPSADPPPF
ncbi:HNH endonuclease [Microbacterium sp. LWH7-1.2]|uniref:HNH endonuclease signature motif containing protein n=1 Tax=Microbacterium sp. LWH7-1.2 TaxID=3135257 RepID=UPI003139A0E4